MLITEPDVATEIALPAPRALTDVRHRRVSCSPDEEFVIRAQTYGAPIPLEEEIIFLLLTDEAARTITKQGIAFKHPMCDESHLYWSPSSSIFNEPNIGQCVAFRYDPADPLVIYVMKDNGALWDALPSDEMPDMLDTAAQNAARERTQTPYRQSRARLDRFHKDTATAQAGRKKRNADRRNFAGEFPNPDSASSKSDRDAAPVGNGRLGETTASDNEVAGGESSRLTLTDAPTNSGLTTRRASITPSASRGAEAEQTSPDTTRQPSHAASLDVSRRGEFPVVPQLTADRDRVHAEIAAKPKRIASARAERMRMQDAMLGS